jgi:hypothetical protein
MWPVGLFLSPFPYGRSGDGKILLQSFFMLITAC